MTPNRHVLFVRYQNQVGDDCAGEYRLGPITAPNALAFAYGMHIGVRDMSLGEIVEMQILPADDSGLSWDDREKWYWPDNDRHPHPET